MTNYYYLVPSLPSIKSGSDSYMSVETFLSMCRGKITKKDYATLEKVALSDEVVESNSFVKAYTRFRSCVEKELAYQRSLALGIDSDEYRNDGAKDNYISSVVRKAVNELSPLEGEKLILSLYFSFLDRNVKTGHNYDITFLISYVLKLQLLSRRSSFEKQKGKVEFNRLFNTLKKEIFQ